MKTTLQLTAVLAMLTIIASPASADGEVNVYSARHYDTDLALYDTFTERTGIRVNLIEGGSDALIERIAQEGELSPADMLITVDGGRLWRAAEAGILQPVSSTVLETRIPANLQDPNNLWFGLSKRARVLVVNKSESLPVPATYEDLAKPAYKGRVCMRSSSNIYNLSLMASLIEKLGAGAAEDWARGVVNNFARSPQGNDTAQLRAVAAGECGVSIANTYYIGRLLGSDTPEDQAVMDNLEIVFPNQGDRGTHVNLSGAGVTRYAPNRENAVAFLEYLTSEYAQRLFAEGNNEYPIVGDTTGPIAELGNFKEDDINASVYGARQAEAVRVYDRAGWK